MARRCRVITFSLADEPTCGGTFDAADGFECYVRQIGRVLDAAGLARATICGVSYGGLIAATFAARHPDRVAALVLASALPPAWTPDARAQFFLRAPWLLSPLFCLGSLRMFPEIAAAAGGLVSGVTLALRHAENVLRHMFSPGRMARRVHLLASIATPADMQSIAVPTLVVTGEAALDRVVPVALTNQYLRLVPGAQGVTLPRTGHLGLITRPEAFADLVVPFAAAATQERKERIG
jgi:pimeloyl-ACP methyl ester carboxylesterase